MSLSTTVQTVKDGTAKVIGYVSAAVTRIFGLNDDDYPATGVQPFEGEPSDKREIKRI